MKRKLLKLKVLLVICLSVSLFSVYFTPARADAVTDTACTAGGLIPGIGPLITFGCLGQAANTAVMGLDEKLAEVMTRHIGDFVEGLMVTTSTAIGGTWDPKKGGQVCQNDDYCPTEQKCDLVAGSPTINHCVPRNTAEREKYLADISTNPYLRGGALAAVGQTTQLVYTNPLRITAAGYFEQVFANNILNPQPAYAQPYPGLGAAQLQKSGITSLWQYMRNIAFLALAVVLVIFGIGVMIQQKLDPRTTVTAQMALPNVALAVILIYFSFPIAGLLMDLGNVTTSFVKFFWTQAAPSVSGVPFDVSMGSLWTNFIFSGVNINIGSPVIELVLQIVIRLWALFISLGILMTVVSRYGMLFVQVILAPFTFLSGALPGRQESMSRWVKTFLVNVLTFPGIFFIANLANYIRVIGGPGGAYQFDSPPGFNTTMWTNLSGLIAIGLLSQAPKVPAILEELFDVVPGAHSSRAGVDMRSAARGIPIVGGLMGIG